MVISAGYLKDFGLDPVQFSAECMGTLLRSLVGSQHFTLPKVKLNVYIFSFKTNYILCIFI